MFWRTRRKSGQEGQALVETTFMILAVLLLLMGIIEFGFLFLAYVRVSNATREGARAGSLWLMTRDVTTGPGCPCYTPSLDETVRNAAQDEFAAIEDDDVAILTENMADPRAGDAITVTTTYDYPLPVVSALPIIRDVIPSPFPVSRRTVMRFQ